MKSLSHGEEFIQNDILQALNNPQKVSNLNYFFIFRKKILRLKIKSMIPWKIRFIVEEVKISCLSLTISIVRDMAVKKIYHRSLNKI